VPGDADRSILLEKPGPPSMDEKAAAVVREQVTKGRGRARLRHRLRAPRPLRQPAPVLADVGGLSRREVGGRKRPIAVDSPGPAAAAARAGARPLRYTSDP
jgi:hypothetical protein